MDKRNVIWLLIGLSWVLCLMTWVMRAVAPKSIAYPIVTTMFFLSVVVVGIILITRVMLNH